MASFAQMGTMDVWYARLDEDELMASIRAAAAGTVQRGGGSEEAGEGGQGEGDERRRARSRPASCRNRCKADKEHEKAAKQAEKGAEKTAEKAHPATAQALSKLGELVDGQYRIISQPPMIVPARDLASTFGCPRTRSCL